MAESLRELAGFEITGRHPVREQRGCGDDGGDSSQSSQSCPKNGVYASEADIVSGHALVGNSALLEKEHPRSHGRPDIRQKDQHGLLVTPPGRGFQVNIACPI